MILDYNKLKQETKAIVVDIIERSALKKGQIFVLGLSSSEVSGGLIGKNSSSEIGEIIVEVILKELHSRGIYLAVQGCEHVNRALVVEAELAERQQLESLLFLVLQPMLMVNLFIVLISSRKTVLSLTSMLNFTNFIKKLFLKKVLTYQRTISPITTLVEINNKPLQSRGLF